jgi:hypothetical protein
MAGFAHSDDAAPHSYPAAMGCSAAQAVHALDAPQIDASRLVCCQGFGTEQEMEKLNQWLGILANVGVVVGIVFLVFELQQSQQLAEREADEYLGTSFNELRMRIVEDPRLADVYVRGLEDLAQLNKVDLLTFNSMFATYTVTFARLYERASNELVSWEQPFEAWYQAQFAGEGGRLHYRCYRTFLENYGEFIRFVDGLFPNLEELAVTESECSAVFHGPVPSEGR